MQDNGISYWKKFVAEYYAPGSKKRWCFSKYENIELHSTGVFCPRSMVWPDKTLRFTLRVFASVSLDFVTNLQLHYSQLFFKVELVVCFRGKIAVKYVV